MEIRTPNATVNPWWLAIRPKTLSASVAPVAVGTALAAHDHHLLIPAALAALVGALGIQIGTNLTNDVLDFRRGADTDARVGPTRVVQAGLLSERAVTWGALAAFGMAMLAGLYLIAVAGWPILLLGGVSIVCGVLYTAGPLPLAYLGLGDLFVWVFFGVAAVAGTYYVQASRISLAAVWMGLAVGALAVALLAVNNLRDIPTDRSAGKRTLAVRMGDGWTREYIAALLIAAFALPPMLAAWQLVGRGAFAVLLAVPLAAAPVRSVLRGTAGRDLNPVLGMIARLQIVYAALLTAGLLID